MADNKKKKLKPIKDDKHFNLWRLGYEGGGQLPDSVVDARFTNETLAMKEAERLNAIKEEKPTKEAKKA